MSAQKSPRVRGLEESDVLASDQFAYLTPQP